MFAAGECVFAVAPNAAHRAARQSNERARPPGMRRFALNRMKNFSHTQHAGILDSRAVIVDLAIIEVFI